METTVRPKVKIVRTAKVQTTAPEGYMSLEESRQIIKERIHEIYKSHDAQTDYRSMEGFTHGSRR